MNAEFATQAQVLREGDEVGLLPPVSGGMLRARVLRAQRKLWTRAERADCDRADPRAIDAEKLVAAAKRGEDGAVVVFDGIVRNNTRGRQTLYLDYEAYEEMAVRQMQELAGKARERFGVRQVTMVHRLGRLEVGETSVLIVVAAAHRGRSLRGLPLAHRHAQEDRAHLEEGDLCGRRRVGGGRAVSRRAGRDAAGGFA